MFPPGEYPRPVLVRAREKERGLRPEAESERSRPSFTRYMANDSGSPCGSVRAALTRSRVTIRRLEIEVVFEIADWDGFKSSPGQIRVSWPDRQIPFARRIELHVARKRPRFLLLAIRLPPRRTDTPDLRAPRRNRKYTGERVLL